METQEGKKIEKRKSAQFTQLDSDTEVLSQYEMLKFSGIPIKKAVFHSTVQSFTGEPEYSFQHNGSKPSRTAKMWYTPHGLICEQYKGTTLALKKIIPLAAVKDSDIL